MPRPARSPASAVRARATATFHAAKPGLWIDPGKTHAGEVRVIDIGIPAGGPGEPQVGLISDRASDGIPRRGRASNKFAAGSVLVCGGSLGLTGAPCLASESAMRAGAGYVTACVPSSLNVIFESRLLEVMTVPLPDTDGALEPWGVEGVLERADRAERARARARPGASAGDTGVRAATGPVRARAAAARRRWAERARRRARFARRARRLRPC